MEWLWGIIAVGVALYLWRRSSASPAAPASSEAARLGMNMASDRELMLATFRRELANYLVRQDPDRFLRFYRKARAAEIATENADKEERHAQLTIISKRYPFYTDFDYVGNRRTSNWPAPLADRPWSRLQTNSRPASCRLSMPFEVLGQRHWKQ
jgi:hypothetical protein